MEGVKGTSQCVEGNTSYWRGLGPEATDPRKDKRVAVSRFLVGGARRALQPSASGPSPLHWRASEAAQLPPLRAADALAGFNRSPFPEASGMMHPLAAG